MKQVFISLGTNIEPRFDYLKKALHFLENHKEIHLIKKSKIYETDPVGYLEQDDFLNMVVQLHTTLSPLRLLDYCQDIEKQLGRERTLRFGPRTIDLDLLVYENKIIETDRLIIPHPRMHKRSFVLVPLREVAPELMIPTFQETVSDLLKKLSSSEIEQVRVWQS